MTPDRLRALHRAAEAAYRREHEKLRPVLAEEARVRGALARLDAQIAGAHVDLATNHTLQAVGAGLLWQGWSQKTRRDLNIELARATAQKLAGLDGLRRAFGRKEALLRLIEKAETARRAERTRRRDEELLSGPALWPRNG